MKRLKDSSWSLLAVGSGSLSASPPAGGAPGPVAGAPGTVEDGVVATSVASGGAGWAKRDLYIFGPCHATSPRNSGRRRRSTFFCLASFAFWMLAAFRLAIAYPVPIAAAGSSPAAGVVVVAGGVVAGGATAGAGAYA